MCANSMSSELISEKIVVPVSNTILNLERYSWVFSQKKFFLSVIGLEHCCSLFLMALLFVGVMLPCEI